MSTRVAALDVRALAKRFGGVVAADDLSLQLDAGARHALIGPNGAGKTTFVRLVAGALEPDSGTVRVGGTDVTHASPHARVLQGLVRSYQITSLFPSFSVFENIALAVSQRLGNGLSVSSARGFSQAVVDQTEAIAIRLGLAGKGSVRVGDLPYGERRLVDLAITLALEPRVLLLDEPAAGLPAADRRALLAALQALPANVAVLLIEHDMDLVFEFAARITVLAEGRCLASGSPAEIRSSPEVRAAYLGKRHG